MAFANITFTVQTNLRYVANDFVKVYHDANNFILGRVVSYDAGTGSLVVAPTASVGSGTYTSWNVELIGYEGSSGTSGSSGTTGTSGTAATSGTEGTSGSFGTSGSSATSGTSGTEGESSSSGTSGTTGTAGLDGESGSSASSGTSGTSGTAGTSGFSGSSGTSGLSGLSANSGSSGTSGTSGATGPNGPTGPQGPTGPTGPTGPAGPGTPYNQDLYTTSNVYFYNLLSGCAGIVYASSFRIPDGGRFVNSGDQGTPWYGSGSNWYTFGACGATSFYTTSTREVKTNIEDFTRSALDIINSIEIVTYRYENLDTYLKVGFIADDAPEEVATKNHDQMVIPTTVNLAMKAIQELNQKIEILKNNKL